MSTKTYDTLKLIALIAAPLIVLIATTLNVWDVPHTSEISATLAAVDVFIGALVKIASDRYNKENEDA